MTRVAIVTAATGNGHLVAARALAEALRARGRSVEVVDVGAAHAAVARLVGLYNALLRRPPGWMAPFFQAVNAGRLDRLVYPLARRWAIGEVRRIRPTAFLSVHPMVNYGIAEMLERAGADIPLGVVLTDVAPPFWRGWAEPRAAVTTAPTAEALDQLAAWGAPASRLQRAPIPIAPGRHQPAGASQRREVLRTLGLQAGRLTVVFDAGTACRAAALRAYRALAAAPDLANRIQTIFLAGRDPQLLRRARGVPAPFPTAVLPWREDLGTIFAAADLLFTKPGALTVSEALAAGVPLLLDTCGGVMPQERGGARWVAAQGAGWAVEDPAALPRLLRDLPADAREAARERALAAVSGHAGTVLDRLEAAVGWGAAGSAGAALAAAGGRV